MILVNLLWLLLMGIIATGLYGQINHFRIQSMPSVAEGHWYLGLLRFMLPICFVGMMMPMMHKVYFSPLAEVGKYNTGDLGHLGNWIFVYHFMGIMWIWFLWPKKV